MGYLYGARLKAVVRGRFSVHCNYSSMNVKVKLGYHVINLKLRGLDLFNS